MHTYTLGGVDPKFPSLTDSVEDMTGATFTGGKNGHLKLNVDLV